MALLAVALAMGWLTTGFSLLWLARSRERDRRDFNRRETALLQRNEALLDRCMYMAEKPWNVPQFETEEIMHDPYKDFAYAEQVAIETAGTVNSE